MKRAILTIAAGSVACAAMPAHAVLFLAPERQASRAPAFGTLAPDGEPGRVSPDWTGAETAEPNAIVLGAGVAVWDADVTMSPFLRDRQTRDAESHSRPSSRGDEERATPGRLPEPASWAMMLLGFSALGFTLRRRPKTSARIRFS